MPLTKRDAERLIRNMGGYFDHHGERHDIWYSANEIRIEIPRHPGDLSPGVERNIKKKLGLI